MKQLFFEMAGLVARQEPFVLASVISRNGSAPRAAGAKMLLRQDGTTAGTVGGGILEAQVEQLARQVFADRQSIVRGFQFTGKDASTMDAICGGEVEVLVEWLDGSDSGLVELFTRLNAAIESHRKTWLVTGLPAGNGHRPHALVHEDGSLTGSLPTGMSVQGVHELRMPTILPAGEQRVFVEPLDIAGTVYIFGAGRPRRLRLRAALPDRG